MRPSERVDLIRKVADRLAQQDYSWDDIALELGTFRIPESNPDYWKGSTRGYVMHHLREGSDEDLQELGEHLFGPARTALDPADLPWEAGAVRLFLSHTSAHAALAGGLRDIFLPWRIDAFVAHTSIDATRQWERLIEGALASCDALCALITDDFRSSEWCDQEVGYCLARGVPIVPVKLAEDPHGFIRKLQAATVSRPGSAAWVADSIFRALARNAAIRNAMAGPVVYRYAGSRSFDGARANFALLREVPAEAWTRELVEVAERAHDSNGQIAHAGVRDPRDPESKPMPQATSELLAPHRERLGMNTPPPSLDDDIPF